MAKIEFPKKQEQRLIPKHLLEYADELQKNHPDPSAEWGGSGAEYTAGTGIKITNDNISIDEAVVATKNDIPDVSGFISDDDLSKVLENYELKSEAFSGSYNDLTDKPTIPTKTSDLTNDSGYITGINSSDVITALGYTPGTSNFSGNYNDLTNKPTIPTVNNNTITITQGGVTKGSFRLNQSTDQTIALDAGGAGVQIQNNSMVGLVTESTDSTNKPSISISDFTGTPTTYKLNLPEKNGTVATLDDIPAIPSTDNLVTTDTDQNITGVKTFVGEKRIKFKQSGTFDKLGFTFYDKNNVEKGYLEYNSDSNGLYLGRFGNNAVNELGFYSEKEITSVDGNIVYHSHKLLVPNVEVNGKVTDYIPISINNIKADSSGNITLDIPDVSNYYTKAETDALIPTIPTLSTVATTGSYNDLIDKPTIPESVSGTNDGTNWTSLTIGSNTYNIPSGGGSGSSATANLFLHNFRLACTTSTNVTSYIEATIITKSSTQILTIAELYSQIAALQDTPYNDTVVGVIFGQMYRSNNPAYKQSITGFGLTGSASNPNLYMASPNGASTSSFNFVSTSTPTGTISYINKLMAASGSEVADSCSDVVTPALV